jgi:hypothetical protein
MYAEIASICNVRYLKNHISQTVRLSEERGITNLDPIKTVLAHPILAENIRQNSGIVLDQLEIDIEVSNSVAEL